jgi:hypothetical protein
VPRKKKTVTVHRVRAELRLPQLARAGSSLDLEIYAGDQKIGTLIMGRGSLFWYGRKRHTRKRIAWTAFADMMDRLAYGKN